jgi:hypothetical protein
VEVPSQGDGGHDEMVRHLRLRGGALDGMSWSGVIDIGKRVCCGRGPWSKECAYVVTKRHHEGPSVLVAPPPATAIVILPQASPASRRRMASGTWSSR